MISVTEFYGGSRYLTPSSNITLESGIQRVILINPTASVNIDMPDIDSFKGYHFGKNWFIVHFDNTFSLTIRDHNNATMAILTGPSAVQAFLVKDGLGGFAYKTGPVKTAGWVASPL